MKHHYYDSFYLVYQGPHLVVNISPKLNRDLLVQIDRYCYREINRALAVIMLVSVARTKNLIEKSEINICEKFF